jgi:putative ABC transport system substrate-binding protein
MRRLPIFRRLALGLSLIALTSGILLLSDWRGRSTAAGESPRSAEGRVYKVGLVYIGPDPALDLAIRGLFDGFRELGLTEGKNLELRQSHAAGELGNIPAVLQNLDNQDVDLILTFTTPVLTAACHTVKKKPVVFTLVSDPIAAGAGVTDTDHVPFVTGVGSFPPIPDMIDLIRDVLPGVKSVGTLYNSSEANSRKVVGVGRELFPKQGIRLEEVTVTSSNEVQQAAEALATRRIQALWISGDNTALGAFEAVVSVALSHKLPLFVEDPEFVPRGALAGVGLGSYDSGYSGGKLAARVLLGENPRDLPFEHVTKKSTVVNQDIARRLGITFPEKVLRAAAAN